MITIFLRRLPRAIEDDGEVDHELEETMIAARSGASGSVAAAQSRKNKKQVLEWDQQMEDMQREKKAAEAMRGKCSGRPQRLLTILHCALAIKSRSSMASFS